MSDITPLSPQQQRRQEERQRRRDEILDAASTVFAERGYDAATMDDVARQARVSRALVYVYFRDKQALNYGVCERALHMLRALFEEAAATEHDGVTQLAAVGRAYIRFAEAQPSLFQALSLFEARDTDPDSDDPEVQACMNAGRAVHEITVRAIHRGMADGTLHKDIDNPMQVAMTLWGFTHGIVQIAQHKNRLIEREGIAVEDFVQDALMLALRALEPPQ